MTIEIKVVETTALGSSTEVTTVDGLMIGLTQFNGRNGAVQPAAGDYTAAQVTSTSNATVQADLDALRGSATNVDNTSDADKPVSTATQEALDLASLISSASSKADMEFNAKQNSSTYAGSGSIEWGKHTDDGVTQIGINQGLWTGAAAPNILRLGRDIVTGAGDSRTGHPLMNVAGTTHTINAINSGHANILNIIGFPPAPDGTKTYDTATGVTTTHATSNEAFEGLITNGDFRNGTDGWDSQGAGTTHTIVDGALKYENNGSYGAATPISQSWEVGKEYRLKFRLVAISGGNETNTGNLPDGNFFPTNGVGNYETTFIANGTDDLVFAVGGNTAGHYKIIDHISVMPSTESVVTSRKDLVILETWHEDIESGAAREDIVYPLGNAQFGTTTYSGISLISNGKPQGYSAFGEWDTSTTGYGARWSDMSYAQKQLFIDDPDNNIYYDESIKKFIQVRYRIRVIEGLGDDWEYVRPSDTISGAANLSLSYSETSPQLRVKPQGMLSTATGLTSYATSPTGDYQGMNSIFAPDLSENGDVGAWQARSTVGSTFAHNGKCFAAPIALVQRLNQGAYHHTYNSDGCRAWRDDNIGGGQLNTTVAWHAISHPNCIPKSVADCFNIQPTGVPTQPAASSSSGYIGAPATPNTGRDDQYEFYDAIYAGQVKDLRLDANKKELVKLLEDSSRSDVAATTRGWGKVPFTIVKVNQTHADFGPTTSDITHLYTTPHKLQVGDTLRSARVGNDSDFTDYVSIVTAVNDELSVVTKPAIGSLGGLQVRGSTDIHTTSILSAEYDVLPWVDIIGSPANIAATFPNGCVGQWIPELAGDNNTLNRKAGADNGRLYTTDNGVTWLTASGLLDFTTNTGYGYLSTQPTRVTLQMYEALSDFTTPSNNLPVLGGVGSVFAGDSNGTHLGNRLQPSLTGTIGKNNTTVSTQRLPMKTYTFNETGVPRSSAQSAIYTDWIHEPLSLGNPANDSHAVKTLMGLTEVDGLIYPLYRGNEIIWDTSADNIGDFTQVTTNGSTTYVAGQYYRFNHVDFGAQNNRAFRCIIAQPRTPSALISNNYMNNDSNLSNADGVLTFEVWDGSGWGDNSTIPIVDMESTINDNNGNSVKTFCHIGTSPIGIASN
ncbi:MAG: hypothetical protein MJH10_16265 [Epibacterium sp.]|nr:hypothetical protein [Epibacterium sp.]NQX75068.1 hypothetical protein [Epibacterium sp.]